jgi:hypothetical protein
MEAAVSRDVSLTVKLLNESMDTLVTLKRSSEKPAPRDAAFGSIAPVQQPDPLTPVPARS